MTNKEKEFKKAFKHRHITNVELVDKGKNLIVAYRYRTKRDFTAIRKHVLVVTEKFENLEYMGSTYANDTKNYEYSIAHIKVTK